MLNKSLLISNINSDMYHGKIIEDNNGDPALIVTGSSIAMVKNLGL